MNRRSAGVCLLAIAAFFYTMRHLVAAIFGSNVTTWNRELYLSMLDTVGTDLFMLSAVAAVAGFGYLVWAEIRDHREK